MARVDELGEFGGRFGECGGMPPRPPVLAVLAVLACARAHHTSAERSEADAALIAATRRLNCKGEVKAEHTVKFVRASRSTSSGRLYCQGCFRWLDHARWVGHAASDGALHHPSRSRRAG